MRGFARQRGMDLALWLCLAVLLWLSPIVAKSEEITAIKPPPTGLARIYFYRQMAPLLVAISPDVVVNGKSVGEISLGEVFFRDARPGRYRIFLSGDEEHTVELQLADGDIGYVRATFRFGIISSRITAEEIEATTAVREITAMLTDRAHEPQRSLR